MQKRGTPKMPDALDLGLGVAQFVEVHWLLLNTKYIHFHLLSKANLGKNIHIM